MVNFSGGSGTLSQTVTVTTPGLYRFSFWYDTWNCCTVQATANVGGQTVFNQSLAIGTPTTQFTTQVALNAGASEVLFTAASSGGGIGAFNIDDVSLTFLRMLFLRELMPAGATVNQINVAAAIDRILDNGGTLPPGLLALYGLTDNALLNALSQTSGEVGTAIAPATFQAWNGFFNMVFDPFVQNRGGFGAGVGPMSFAADGHSQSDAVRLAYAAVTPKGATRALPYAPAEPRWNVWGGGYGGRATTGGNASVGSHDTTSRAYGFVVGADHKLAPDTMLGFALAGGGTSFGVSQALGDGSSELFQASVYGRQNWGAAYLMGALGYGWQDISLSRTVTGASNLAADFNANSFAGRLEGGWRFGAAPTGVTPYAAVQVASIRLPGYSERATSGSDAFALSYAGHTDTQTRSELGARFDHAVPVQDTLLTLRGRAAWAHNYDGDNIANATFLSLSGASFAVNGAQPDADSLLVSAGAEFAWRNGFSLAGSFDGEFSGNTQSYAGKGSVRYRW